MGRCGYMSAASPFLPTHGRTVGVLGAEVMAAGTWIEAGRTHGTPAGSQVMHTLIIMLFPIRVLQLPFRSFESLKLCE